MEFAGDVIDWFIKGLYHWKVDVRVSYGASLHAKSLLLPRSKKFTLTPFIKILIGRQITASSITMLIERGELMLSIIIPCYNEGENIKENAMKVKREFPYAEIICVNDNNRIFMCS